ncbi:hypothetical protein BCR34DRAFT_142588 [Clohesyomyces aquaticus]|uniref:Uncharacterized protein n=1 Tax=Clohesyomyces aquaticus TaxID=1231657 RepID=A0A1Y1YLA1_9PLEO|nr:hypothetical protein BCR34DRAFT_142588 [Clohesyomyces aquaticus]
MAPAEPQPSIQRVDELLKGLPRDDERLDKPIQSLEKIRRVLAAVDCFVACYGNVFAGGQFFDSSLDVYETRLRDWQSERKHTWNNLVRRRSSHGEELKAEEEVALLSRDIVVFIVQFALRSNTPFNDGTPHSSPLGALFRRLDNLRIKVGELETLPTRGSSRAEALNTHATELKHTWECLCEEMGLTKEERLCATDVLAASPSRFWVDAWWHATLTHRPVFGTKPSWDWPARKRSTSGMAMATIKLNGDRYFLETYRRSTLFPKTIEWTGTTEPKRVAGKEEPSQPIVLEHKLSVLEKQPDLLPYTPHGMHLKDRLVRFSGTQEVMVRGHGRSSIFDGMTQPEYSFLDAKYWTQFHQDLRGRKAVACFDAEDIASAVSTAHSTKMYLWKDAQSSDIHFHTLSYYSQKVSHYGSHRFEGQELEFPLLWLDGNTTRESSNCLLLLFHIDHRNDGEKRANKRHSGLSHLPSSELRSVGDMYVPSVYKAFLAKYQSLKVNFKHSTDCDSFKEAFEKAHYQDSLIHLLRCLPPPDPTIRARSLPSTASSRSINSFATATSSGSSNVDWLGLPPTWLQSAANPISFPEPFSPITDQSVPTIEAPQRAANSRSSRSVREEISASETEPSAPFPDGHPGNMF